MTNAEIQQQQQQLDADIASLISAFQRETGCRVTEVELTQTEIATKTGSRWLPSVRCQVRRDDF